ncbi:MAG TPA: Xaa-Pro aminopeptidase [Gammaproteobacteria bacterium]|nr:Xaa-Pro aminopeptidase [Gammaproteobacteria bacterium]
MPIKTLPKLEFKHRRRHLMQMMGQNSIAVIPSSQEHIRNRDVEYPFRQDSDFLYLTGFSEPEAVAVFIPGRKQGEYILFSRERDQKKETWTGRRAGQEGALSLYEADDAFPISDIDDILPGLLEHHEQVYYTMGKDAQFDSRLMDWVNQLRKKARGGSGAPHQFTDLEFLLHEMRLYKSRSEMRIMRAAAEVTQDAHLRALTACKPGLYEYEIEAELLYSFHRAGTEPAYPSIVGGGKNGCILHYTENNQVLNDGDLLLIDAGAEYEGYASDVTRTFPVNGRYTPAQRDLYDVVLAAQQAAIDSVIPGNHWNDPHTAAVRVITEGLLKLGILKDKSLGELIKDEAYKLYYMHRTGHWLGLDVHDVGDYKVDDEWRVLEPGMVLTVEPGLYIPAGSKGVAKKYWDIGIRIEDDVLVTKTGHEVLTEKIPRDPETIEALMAT